MSKCLIAGSAEVDITPRENCFLWGYPHVERNSEGVFDPLLSSSLYLSNGETQLLFIANDIIFFSKDLCRRVRDHIHRETNIPPECVLISATHTHSGPTIINCASNADDPHVPSADEAYLDFLVWRVATAACESVGCTFEAEIGIAYPDIEGVGTNRLDPDGPIDKQACVMVVRGRECKEAIACMIVYGMHPTVLHEDFTLFSSDFPGMVRHYLKEHVLPQNCPVIYHNGVCGNLSPRYTARSNTVEEMMRLGFLCAEQIGRAIETIEYTDSVELAHDHEYLRLDPRTFPTVGEARNELSKRKAEFDRLRKSDSEKARIRTAECDLFGAEETLTLAKAAGDGRLQVAIESCLPAEIGFYRIGGSLFASWPGEFFVEYALELKETFPDLTIISMANGELQGYIVTEEAFVSKTYEASNALFDYRNGKVVVEASKALIQRNQFASGKERHVI